MNPKTSLSKLEQIIFDSQELKLKYDFYKKQNKKFEVSNFLSFLLFFDFVLESRNKTQKQTRIKSLFLKKQAYNISLLYNRIKHTKPFSRIPWWNQITDKIYLGALPLRKHLRQFKQEGITSVVTVVEDFERADSCLAKPFRSEHYLKHGIDNKKFETPDFRPISLKTLYEASVFLKTSVDAGKKTYVHCKAGRGRSAATIMAYFVLFLDFDYKKAENLIRSKRPHINLENKKDNIEVLNAVYRLFYEKNSQDKAKEKLQSLT